MSTSAELRAQGNSLFNSGDFTGAEALFSQALALAETEKTTEATSATTGEIQTAVLLANRAAARHQLGRFEDALQDGIAAAAADPKWIKVN